MSADIFPLLTLSLHLSLSYSLLRTLLLSHRSHLFLTFSITSFLHPINSSSSSTQLPLPPWFLFFRLPPFLFYIFHFSIPHPSPSSYSLTQDLTNPPGRPSYMELPRPVESSYDAWFQVSWVPPDYTANLTFVQYRVYYLPNSGVTDTPTITTEVLGVAAGRLTSKVAIISPNKEVISEKGPKGRSQQLYPWNYQCANKGEIQSIDFYSTSTHFLWHTQST